ncbi:glycosyltransferase family 4 protein [Puerhibacterium puerhi]|uniref:glycosyltransferase family 4 protein n=1 Tax=Puerhibacterium puerhi TaxID=2692623 RepID=UPI0013598EE0|nr:glycosyltransferase family 4 protein [Puerhibacterium puerhi]
MRILHVTDSYLPLLGGIETQVARLAGRQAAAGHHVEVVTTTPAAPGARGRSTTVGADGVRVHRVAARVPGGFPVHPRSTAHVLDRLRALEAAGERPDVVHLHMGVLAPTVQAALRPITRTGLPAVLTVHSVWGAARHAFAALDRAAGWSRWPVLWSAVSELTAAPLRRIVAAGGGDPDERVVVLGNGVDVAAWRLARTERGERPDGAAVHVVSATRFAPRKRVLPLVEAVTTAARRLPPGALVATVAGAGEQLEQARRAVAAAGLADVVRLPGRMTPDELRELYTRADVFVAPAVQDAFGIAALEAQAAGLAVVSRSQSGVAERLTDGVDALLADDDAAMARALERLVTEPGLLDRIVAHNRAHALAADWPQVLAATEDAYARATKLAENP